MQRHRPGRSSRLGRPLPGYLEVLDVAVAQSRTLAEADGPLHRVVVNAVFARKMFVPPRSIGQTFKLSRDGTAPSFAVVGVARNTRCENVQGELRPIVYRVLEGDRDFDDGK
jgi:hypothetical protein